MLAQRSASAKRTAPDVGRVTDAGPESCPSGGLTRQAKLGTRSGLAHADLSACAVLLAVCLLAPFGVSAEEAVEHPLIIPKDIKPATCLTCHPEKKEGRFVHTAIGVGCESCHHIVSEKNKTTITLLAEGGGLCAKCHEATNAPVLHGPYKDGQCLVCHDPHSSPFQAQTRAAGNSLCLECHAPRRAAAETVSLFNFEKISKADFEAIPKIELDRTLRFGHPCATHPVSEAGDPLHAGERMSCLSCHSPHASTLPNLLALEKGGREFCGACHRASDRPKDVGLDSQTQPRGLPNAAKMFTFEGCADCRNLLGGDPCAE